MKILLSSLVLTLIAAIQATAFLGDAHDNNEISAPNQGSFEDRTPLVINENGRHLQGSKNRNCEFTGSISCQVLSDGSNCDDLFIRTDLCSKIDVMIEYRYCNNETLEKNKILFIPELSFAELYEEERIELQHTTLEANTCRSTMQRGIVDTCVRNRINADFKIEGWKESEENFGSYCHVYQHYFPKINKYTKPPTPAPVFQSPPQYDLIVNCKLEMVKGGGAYTIPCDQLDYDYFVTSQPTGDGAIDFVRGINYDFIIKSETGEKVKVNDITITENGTPKSIFSNQDVLVPPGDQVLVTQYSDDVDFGAYSGDKFELGAEVTVTGLESGRNAVKTKINAFDVPDIEFKWKLEPTIKCIVKGTNTPTPPTCEDYLAAIPASTNQGCTAEVEYTYTVVNTGNRCEGIETVLATVDGKGEIIPVSDWLFCPEDKVVLADRRMQNLCNFESKEIDYKLELDGTPGSPGESFYSFPSRNSNTMPPRIGPILAVDRFTCTIANSVPKESCSDYIKTRKQLGLPCKVNVIYQSRIRNVGDTCVEIESVQKGVDSKVYQINTNNWTDEKKNFCYGEKILLRKPAPKIDLCSFAGQEIDFEVTLMGTGGESLVDFGSILFSGPNSVSSVPVVSPTSAPSKACSAPEGFSFKLNRSLCGMSSNSQPIGSTNRRRLSHRGKGSSKKNPVTCAGCVDHYEKVTTMDPPPFVTVYAKDCANNSRTTMLKKGSMKFFDDPGNHNTNPPTFIFEPDTMPACVLIEIREISNGYARKAQTVSFDTTCLNGNRLSVGDSFGAVEIVEVK